MDNRKTLIVMENEPYEYIDDEKIEIGARLVDYLPAKWEPVQRGAQKHGVNIKIVPSEDSLIKTDVTEEDYIQKAIKLIKGMKNTRFVNLRDVAFKTLLCEFLTVCNRDSRLYTESNFVRIMGINGFTVPKVSYRAFDTFKNEEITTVCMVPGNLYNIEDILEDMSDIKFARVYSCEKDEHYYIAVLLELIRQKKFLKQCQHCNRWFIVNAKRDEKYCKRTSPYDKNRTCAEVMKRIKDTKRIKDDPINKAKERARSRAYSREIYHPGALAKFKAEQKEWQSLYKSGVISDEEYIAKLEGCMKSERKGPKQ